MSFINLLIPINQNIKHKTLPISLGSSHRKTFRKQMRSKIPETLSSKKTGMSKIFTYADRSGYYIQYIKNPEFLRNSGPQIFSGF